VLWKGVNRRRSAVDIDLAGVPMGTVTALGIGQDRSDRLDAIMRGTAAGIGAQVASPPAIPIILISLHTIPRLWNR